MLLIGFAYSDVNIVGIFSSVAGDNGRCDELCKINKECYLWDTSTPKIKKCLMYSYVNGTAKLGDTTGLIDGRDNNIPVAGGYSTTLQIPSSDNLPFYFNDKNAFYLYTCADACTANFNCLGFSGKPFNTFNCQYFYNESLNSETLPVVNFTSTFVYLKSQSTPAPTPSIFSDPLEPIGIGVIAGIVIGSLAVCLGLGYTFYRRCLVSQRYMQTDNNFNIDHDPDHGILANDVNKKCAIPMQSLEREYIPKLTVMEDEKISIDA